MGVSEIKFIESVKHLVDFFTKPLVEDRFNYHRTELGILHNRKTASCICSLS